MDNLIKNNNLHLLLFKKGSNITISSLCICFIPLDIGKPNQFELIGLNTSGSHSHDQ
nr:MAG TPA: hypothetical protein [Caudoviricetes sp.]